MINTAKIMNMFGGGSKKRRFLPLPLEMKSPILSTL